MAEKILQVNFGLNVSSTEYQRIAASVASSFAAVPGLRWKLWFLNDERGEAGGIYLFDDQRALDAFMQGPLAATIATHPALRNATMKYADVMTEVTTVTRGPIGTPINA